MKFELDPAYAWQVEKTENKPTIYTSKLHVSPPKPAVLTFLICFTNIAILMNILEPHVFALKICNDVPDNKVHGANMGPTWVLSAPYWPH